MVSLSRHPGEKMGKKMGSEVVEEEGSVGRVEYVKEFQRAVQNESVQAPSHETDRDKWESTKSAKI